MATQRRNSIFMFSQSHAKGSSPRIQGLGPGLDRVPCGYPKPKLNFHFGLQSCAEGPPPRTQCLGPGLDRVPCGYPKAKLSCYFWNNLVQGGTVIINHHQSLSNVTDHINYHQSPSSVINRHHLLSMINHYQSSSIVHHPSSINCYASSVIYTDHHPSLINGVIIHHS